MAIVCAGRGLDAASVSAACTVLIRGAAARSCVVPVSNAAGAAITTLEGLATSGKLDPVQQAWIDEQVPQCGFCQNGQIMTAKPLLTNVTSIDWLTYPSLRHTDAPEKIDVVLVNGDPNPNRPDLPMYGGGETVCKPLLAAVANAIFDATGVRLRRLPFRDARVLAALKSAGV